MSNSKNTEKAVIPAQGEPLPSWYGDLLGEVKATVSRARARAQRAVNTELVQMYWEIGHHILRRQKEEGWGTKVVARLATDLKTTFPNQRGFSRSNLMYMHLMARTWPEPIVQQPVGQLPWGHIIILVTKLKTRSELDFYALRAVQQGWSRDTLERHILQELHLTEGAADANFEATLPDGAAVARDIAKDPYRLDFLGLDKEHSERELEDALVANIVSFLTELGVGFAFVGRQYSVVIGGEEFRIDLLFYHLKLHRYVVVELKTKAPRPEHIGKLGFYVTVVDQLVRDPDRDDATLGILIGADRNRAACRIALQSSNRPLAVSSYATLPPQVQALMPSEEDLARVAQEVLDDEGGG
ncbi:putative nuclease of restriction endonuclease-like (RecB) superfamily [Streptomyces sp. SLBN-118]|uniref:PDDEXK nuclease domain-containing protein n=1 Tax=Streptomyces sp. SLBN-118 TaxID=2768454 RepID=UPI0011742B99|nr:PDDEXK nuclease domain-containing protein [Streptomyces sp. SLBN-118]TQK45516.1 putative nuclease of restriction endonuclease-like (RecB) superfamily [Streptomyces sp. SLBN-118]